MLDIRKGLRSVYSDVFTPAAVDALEALAPLDDDRQAVMTGRIARRAARAREHRRIEFLDPAATIARTRIRVQDARDGRFVGSGLCPAPRSVSRRRPPAARETGPTTGTRLVCGRRCRHP
jgi:hypothetical protein